MIFMRRLWQGNAKKRKKIVPNYKYHDRLNPMDKRNQFG